MNERPSKNGSGLSWPTVVLILATGAGNLVTTHQGNMQITEEQREGLQKIRQLHNDLDDFKRWQRQASENQQTILANDSRLLEEVHRIAVRLDHLKILEQQKETQ